MSTTPPPAPAPVARLTPNALPAQPGPRALRWLDPLLGLGLGLALLMALATAWPGAAWATDRRVGNGQAATELRQVAAFDIVVSQELHVIVRQGTANAVQVQADSNLLPLLETGVDGRRLLLRWHRGSRVKTTVKPVVTVTAATLSALVVAGSGDIVGEL